MNFDLTPEQISLCEHVKSFASEKLAHGLRDRDASKEPIASAAWRADWSDCAEFGFFALNVDAEYGGRGLDTLTTVLALESLGYACPDNGLTLAINGQIWAIQHPIMAFGTSQQKARYLPGLSNGTTVGAHGLTEWETGSDAMGLKTTAVRRDGGYVLNGAKALVGMGPVCDMAVVFATTAPDHGTWGVSAFLVEAGDAGFRRGQPAGKMGLRSVPTGDLIFEDCWIPEDRRLGSEGAGSSIFQATMDWERSFIFSSHVGAMARQLDEALSFAKTRTTFGQPIVSHQSVANRLSDMHVRLETSKLLLYRAAWLMDKIGQAPLEAAVTKLAVSEALVESSLDAVRIHGGRGYLTEFGVEAGLRDTVGGLIYSGTSDIQRQIIARLLQ